jgi:hypothetical protein
MIDFGMMELNLLFINVKNIIKKTNRDGYFRKTLAEGENIKCMVIIQNF